MRSSARVSNGSTPPNETRDSRTDVRLVSAALFLSLFAAQAAVIAMSPVLADAASDLDVSTATAGQLRSITGVAAGVTALALGVLAGRVGLGRQLLAGAALLVVGSAASAAAPSFWLLSVAQLPVGVAVAVLTTAGTVAAAEWVDPAHRARVLSHALIGQPAAWIVGMPLIGLVGEVSWRYGWIVLPLAAAIVAGILVAPRARSAATPTPRAPARVALGDRAIACWLVSELLANAAWAGTLVYAGALFVDSHATSVTVTGVLLAVGASAYVAGNVSFRHVTRFEPRRVLVLLAVVLTVVDGLFGIVRPDAVVSTILFSAAAFVAGGRTLVTSSYALSTPAEIRPTVTSLRVATMQFGYLVGSVVAGAALSLEGYAAYGAAMGGLFLAAAVTLAAGTRTARHRPLATPRPNAATS